MRNERVYRVGELAAAEAAAATEEANLVEEQGGGAGGGGQSEGHQARLDPETNEQGYTQHEK